MPKELGADCTPVKFTLSTVLRTQRKEGQQLCLDVVGVATGKGVRLDKVWTTETLPVTEEKYFNDQGRGGLATSQEH